MPKLIQYQELAFVPFTPATPNAEAASMNMTQIMPSNRLSADLYQQFVGPVFPIPAVITPLRGLEWGPTYPVYFPALRMVQDGFNQFVPQVMTPPIPPPPPPTGQSMQGMIYTYITTNSVTIG